VVERFDSYQGEENYCLQTAVCHGSVLNVDHGTGYGVKTHQMGCINPPYARIKYT
jgi:hypothetical protein